ncbi:MAG: hypothetical protein ABIH21_04915 [Patescibacteria group bacterium]
MTTKNTEGKVATFVSYYNSETGIWYSHEVDHRDPRKVISSGIIPRAFRFYDAVLTTVVQDSKKFKHYGEPQNVSPTYFTDEDLFKSLVWKNAELLQEVPASHSCESCTC